MPYKEQYNGVENLTIKCLVYNFQLVENEITLFGGIPIWKVALTIHVTGWILQFIGHGVFEGKDSKSLLYVLVIKVHSKVLLKYTSGSKLHFANG